MTPLAWGKSTTNLPTMCKSYLRLHPSSNKDKHTCSPYQAHMLDWSCVSGSVLLCHSNVRQSKRKDWLTVLTVCLDRRLLTGLMVQIELTRVLWLMCDSLVITSLKKWVTSCRNNKVILWKRKKNRLENKNNSNEPKRNRFVQQKKKASFKEAKYTFLLLICRTIWCQV